ncbi:hypothetical protein LPJ66_010204 [Kickxella alabastrina]|uniref:Uncharacterized protein n=1 Tax=Kickxella alabastrina TaxID=61397 RepID=A0ACC1I913_9FUNG|nr:hypothetical protein LPJ66_010204 [Kickxella alabastrina]
MHHHIVIAVFVAALAIGVHATPSVLIYKRQTNPEVSDTGIQSDTSAAADINFAPAGETTNNLAGNSLTQIDDSINIVDASIDYPDEAQLLGNSGTAISGNNNEISPIINAPVTVIINNNNGGRGGGGQNRQQRPSEQPGSPDTSKVSPPKEQQQPAATQYPYPTYENGQNIFDISDPRVQWLITYAMLISQNNLDQLV